MHGTFRRGPTGARRQAPTAPSASIVTTDGSFQTRILIYASVSESNWADQIFAGFRTSTWKKNLQVSYKACDVKKKIQCFSSYQERKSLCRFLKLQLHVTVLAQLQSVCRARVDCIIRQCQEYSWIGVEVILCNLFSFCLLSFFFFFNILLARELNTMLSILPPKSK